MVSPRLFRRICRTISTAADAQLTTSYVQMAKAQAVGKHGTFGVICPNARTAHREVRASILSMTKPTETCGSNKSKAWMTCGFILSAVLH